MFFLEKEKCFFREVSVLLRLVKEAGAKGLLERQDLGGPLS